MWSCRISMFLAALLWDGDNLDICHCSRSLVFQEVASGLFSLRLSSPVFLETLITAQFDVCLFFFFAFSVAPCDNLGYHLLHVWQCCLAAGKGQRSSVSALSVCVHFSLLLFLAGIRCKLFLSAPITAVKWAEKRHGHSWSVSLRAIPWQQDYVLQEVGSEERDEHWGVFAYFISLPASIDTILPDIFLPDRRWSTRTHRQDGTDWVYPFIQFLAEIWNMLRKMSCPWSLCTANSVVRGGTGSVWKHGEGGFAERGSAAETGLCASDNTTAFDGVWPFSVGEYELLRLKCITATDSIGNDWI